MYNGSDSNTSAHTRFAKPLETRRTSHNPETYSIIHYLSHMVRQAVELEFQELSEYSIFVTHWARERTSPARIVLKL